MPTLGASVSPAALPNECFTPLDVLHCSDRFAQECERLDGCGNGFRQARAWKIPHVLSAGLLPSQSPSAVLVPLLCSAAEPSHNHKWHSFCRDWLGQVKFHQISAVRVPWLCSAEEQSHVTSEVSNWSALVDRGIPSFGHHMTDCTGC